MDIKAAKQVSAIPTPPPNAERAAPAAAPQVPPQPAAQAPAPEPTPEVGADLRRTLENVAQRLREYLRDSQRELEFSVDDDANTTVIRVRDASTGDVIRQIPNEEALQVLRRLNEGSGTFLDLTA